ncbi:peptidoglycan recognition protein family protein [Neobacillus sp. LXY-1]|uniref:peptidoglycan recognition protein family protein n=1 Tax=Neobacillus sp. LXY-1 TaxID=3379133 RepID=UPI003EE2179D
MNIIQRLIPASNKETRPGIRMVPMYITIHETDNPARGADAVAHARLQERGNSRQASWHMQVDENQAIQSIPFDEIAWAAGDGRNGLGNTKSIHIEICVNADGDYQKAVRNTSEVVRELMVRFRIPISNIVQHNHWTGKNCPRYLRSGEKGINWNDFIAMLKRNTVQVEPIVPADPVFVKSNTIIQRVRALVRTDIRKAPTHLSEFVRDTEPGEVFDVYARQGDWHNVGGANWIDGNGGQNLYWIDNPAARNKQADSIPYPGHLIQRGSSGENVLRIQQMLGVSPTGTFGPRTEAAVREFQKQHGLSVDGIVGSKTWTAIF